MYSFNEDKTYKVTSIGFNKIDEIAIKAMVKGMVDTGEYNRTYMQEVVIANYPNVTRDRAAILVLEGMYLASRN